MLELLDIPYTGSDPATLSLALDKALAKKIVRQAGIHTPNFQLMHTGKERLNKEFTSFPLIVKPVAEGSSKGVVSKSVCYNEAELREVVKEIVGKYQQPALIEEYIGGREFTVGLLGERRPRVLPPMEIVFLDKEEKNPVYSFQHKLDWNDRIRYDAPAKIEPALLEKLRTAARDSFMALGCRDVARIDFRMDDKGRIYFIECNPLPGLTPGLERPGAHRPGRWHGLPHAHRRDHGAGHPPLQGARGPPRRGREPVEGDDDEGSHGQVRCGVQRQRPTPRQWRGATAHRREGLSPIPLSLRERAGVRVPGEPRAPTVHQGTSRPSPKPSTQNCGFGSGWASMASRSAVTGSSCPSSARSKVP